MRILEEVITRDDLWKAENVLGEEMVKAAVDVERGLLGIDAEMHADIEQKLTTQRTNLPELEEKTSAAFQDFQEISVRYESEKRKLHELLQTCPKIRRSGRLRGCGCAGFPGEIPAAASAAAAAILASSSALDSA